MDQRSTLAMAASLLVLLACTSQPAAHEAAVPASVRLVAFGDAGTGKPSQTAVGEAMAEVCRARGCDLALELGDNFYDSGVSSARDPQFATAFEQPYAKLAALKVPIYVVLGNHDNSGARAGDGGNNARGNFEVDYDHRTDRPSELWHMPARFYGFSAPTGAGSPLVDFFALDSSPVAPYVDDPDPAWHAETYAAKQLAWLKSALHASRAPWKVAFAHHPYVSHGMHGNAGSYDGASSSDPATAHRAGKLWKQLVEESLCPAGGADLYLAGHDHDLQWLAPTAACPRTEFIVSGAAEGGGKLRALGSGDHETVRWSVGKQAGFFWISFAGDRMDVAAFTLEDGRLKRDASGAPLAAFEDAVTRKP